MLSSRELSRLRSEADIMSVSPSMLISSGEMGALYEKSRWWGRRQLKDWLAEQDAGGVQRVFRRGTRLYTTLAVLDREFPRGRREKELEKRIRRLEADVDRAFLRIAALEQNRTRK